MAGRVFAGRNDLAGGMVDVSNHGEPGQPGQPGKPGSVGVGGAGGQGGVGGEGGTSGGVGGEGGMGGVGIRGPRGHRGGSTWSGVIAYLFLAAAVSVGLFFTARATRQVTNERANRSVQLNDYLARACSRDIEKDAIFVGDPKHPGILQNSLNSFKHNTKLDKAIRDAAVAELQRAIDEVHAVDRKCISDIPPPIPRH